MQHFYVFVNDLTKHVKEEGRKTLIIRNLEKHGYLFYFC